MKELKTSNPNQHTCTTVVQVTPSELVETATMTTKEVAETLGVDVDTVNLTVNRLGFSDVLRKSTGGRPTKVFTEEQATLIKQEIQKHHNLASRQIDNATTELEVMQNYKQATEAMIAMLSAKAEALKAENEEQKAKLIEQAPKVEFFNDVAGSADTIDMKEVAKILNVKGIGRNKLFEILRDKKILDGNNQPYQEYVDRGYFRVIESRFTLPTGEIKISLKTVVFQKGLDYIRKVLKSGK